MRIRVTDSDGGVSILDIEVVIEGAMKLGSFDLAFLDAWSVIIRSAAFARPLNPVSPKPPRAPQPQRPASTHIELRRFVHRNATASSMARSKT